MVSVAWPLQVNPGSSQLLDLRLREMLFRPQVADAVEDQFPDLVRFVQN
jgi:hypothetical protein